MLDQQLRKPREGLYTDVNDTVSNKLTLSYEKDSKNIKPKNNDVHYQIELSIYIV